VVFVIGGTADEAVDIDEDVSWNGSGAAEDFEELLHPHVF
jgi:hypothetical protein